MPIAISNLVTLVLNVIFIAVITCEPANGFSPLGTVFVKQFVMKLANTEEQRLVKTLITMQTKTIIKRIGNSLIKSFIRRLNVPFLALPRSLILAPPGGITLFLQLYFENSKLLDKSCWI